MTIIERVKMWLDALLTGEGSSYQSLRGIAVEYKGHPGGIVCIMVSHSGARAAQGFTQRDAISHILVEQRNKLTSSLRADGPAHRQHCSRPGCHQIPRQLIGILILLHLTGERAGPLHLLIFM